MTDADQIIAKLRLTAHPEGGWYRQTWVADGPGRPTGTCIYYLLKAGEYSHWHRVDATEIWRYYTGSSLLVSIFETITGPSVDNLLDADLLSGLLPQLIVPSGAWQSAPSTCAYTLVGCTVSPGFTFDGFELAPPGFDAPA